MPEAGLLGDPTAVVVGIDPSATGTALCALGGDGEVVHEVLLRTKLQGVARLDEIEQGVRGFFAALTALDRRVLHVTIEGYSYGSNQSRSHLLGEVGGTIKLAIYWAFKSSGSDPRVGFPTIVAPTALKKYATSRSQSKKQEMLLGIYRKWGVEYRDDNQADAYALARLAHAITTRTTAFAYEREVLDKLTEHTEWDQSLSPPKPKKPSTTPTTPTAKPPSSASSRRPVRKASPPPSATPSTTAARSSSGPSARVRSIRRSKPAPSPEGM